MSKTRSPETIGQRIARLRREKGLTQLELAESLGVTQPVISDYEHGALRVHGELIIHLAKLFGTSANEILGLDPTEKADRVIKNRRLYRRVQAIDQLPKRDQEALLRTIDAFLSKAN